MAVVKSCKNTNRRFLWIREYKKTNMKKLNFKKTFTTKYLDGPYRYLLPIKKNSWKKITLKKKFKIQYSSVLLSSEPTNFTWRKSWYKKLN